MSEDYQKQDEVEKTEAPIGILGKPIVYVDMSQHAKKVANPR